MKFPLMLRKTHEEEINRATNIIVEKNRVIAVKKDELEVEKRIKANLQDRNDIPQEPQTPPLRWTAASYS